MYVAIASLSSHYGLRSLLQLICTLHVSHINCYPLCALWCCYLRFAQFVTCVIYYTVGKHWASCIRYAVSPVKITSWSSYSSILLLQYFLTSSCLSTVTLAMTWQTRSWCKSVATLLSQQWAEVLPHLMVAGSQLLSQSLLVASMEYWAARRAGTGHARLQHGDQLKKPIPHPCLASGPWYDLIVGTNWRNHSFILVWYFGVSGQYPWLGGIQQSLT